MTTIHHINCGTLVVPSYPTVVCHCLLLQEGERLATELPMPFSESLAARIRDALARRRNVEEKKLFGCFCIFINGNVLAGVWKDRLIARLGPDEGEAALREPHVRQFDITGRPMRNWVAVEPEGVEDDDQLKGWIERAVKFVKALPAKEK